MGDPSANVAAQMGPVRSGLRFACAYAKTSAPGPEVRLRAFDRAYSVAMSFKLPSLKQVMVAVGIVAGFYGAIVLTSPLEDEPAEPTPSVTVDRDRPDGPEWTFVVYPPEPRGNTYLGWRDDPLAGRAGDASPR